MDCVLYSWLPMGQCYRLSLPLQQFQRFRELLSCWHKYEANLRWTLKLRVRYEKVRSGQVFNSPYNYRITKNTTTTTTTKDKKKKNY